MSLLLTSQSPLEVIHSPTQTPAGRKGRTVGAADKNVVVHVPNGAVTRGGVVENISRFATTVTIGCSHQFPAGGKRWTVRAAYEGVVVHVPNGALTRGGVVEHIIRVAITVKVGCSHQCPPGRKRWTVRA